MSALARSHVLERRANVFAKELWLFPGRKVAADVVLLVIDQFGIRFFRPALRRCIDLVRKGAHANGDSHALDVEKTELILPIKARRGDSRLREPVQRDVIEHVVARKAAGVSEKGWGDHLVTVLVVIENPGSKANGRVRQCVERLGAVRHFDGIPKMLRVEVTKL